MKGMPIVTAVETVEFSMQSADLELEKTIAIPVYKRGATLTQTVRMIRIHTDEGVTGEYLGGHVAEYSTIGMLAHMLIGRNALDREGFYYDCKHALRQLARMGLSVVDIALWDLAGKWHDAPVHQLLGGARMKLPAYASTQVGDYEPDGLSSPKAFADFAEHCLSLGYRAFKVHSWVNAPVADHIAVVRAVGERIGDRMDLMLDPFCAARTFGEAVKLGRACDEYNYFWYEDPFRDGGISAHAHRKLRSLIKTPLLQTEHVRGPEWHADFIEAEGTDFVRIDPDYDGGITGSMKIAHTAESFGLDVELHVGGPVRRHLMAAITNTNYYELALVHPVAGNFVPQFHDFQRDELHQIDADGCVDVPTGAGLGVTYDWEYIDAHRTGGTTYSEA